MDNTNLLARIFKTSSAVIMPVILAACFLCKWPLTMIGLAMSACLVISSPATVALHFFLWLSRRGRLSVAFLWMLLLSTIPIGSVVVAELFADYVPGRTWIVLLLAALGGYVALLTNSFSVSRFFNPTDHEREENDFID